MTHLIGFGSRRLASAFRTSDARTQEQSPCHLQSDGKQRLYGFVLQENKRHAKCGGRSAKTNRIRQQKQTILMDNCKLLRNSNLSMSS